MKGVGYSIVLCPRARNSYSITLKLTQELLHLFAAMGITIVILLAVAGAQDTRNIITSILVAQDTSSRAQHAIRASRESKDWLIIINKSNRTLSVYHAGVLDTVFAAEFGRGRTWGDKERAGDNRTPEGVFKICYRNSQSRFYKALLLDYPLVEDAERGLRNGLINRSDYRRIQSAIELGEIPDQFTGLGGLIEIHGFGSIGFDWTRGCIAVKNPEIDYLFERTRIGTKVIITE